MACCLPALSCVMDNALAVVVWQHDDVLCDSAIAIVVWQRDGMLCDSAMACCVTVRRYGVLCESAMTVVVWQCYGVLCDSAMAVVWQRDDVLCDSAMVWCVVWQSNGVMCDSAMVGFVTVRWRFYRKIDWYSVTGPSKCEFLIVNFFLFSLSTVWFGAKQARDKIE